MDTHRFDAWILGTHGLPEDATLTRGVGEGDVLVLDHERDAYFVLSGEDFDALYELVADGS